MSQGGVRGREPGDFGSSGLGCGRGKGIVRICEKSAKDVFVPVFREETEFWFGGSGGTEGMMVEIGEIETSIVDSAAMRHMKPNPVRLQDIVSVTVLFTSTNGATLPN